MRKDERDLLGVLKGELAFLEKGGYGCSPRESWRQPLIFEDSPSCLNYDSKDQSEPCSSCVLFQLVPPEFRQKNSPCRYIPFNAEAESLDSLYSYSHQHETEEAFGNWLRTTIASIEQGREQARQSQKTQVSPVPKTDRAPGKPLSNKIHPKCANPACPTAFRWLAGGKFFRFRPEFVAFHPIGQGKPALLGIAGVEHFWLCERCSHIFTLAFEEHHGVNLKAIYPELPVAEYRKELATT